MKKKLEKSLQLCGLLFVLAAFLFSGSYVTATNAVYKKVDDCKGQERCSQTKTNEEGTYIREVENDTEPPVFIKAIMSRSEKVYEKEKKQYYVATFMNGANMQLGDKVEADSMQLVIPTMLFALFWFVLAIILIFTYTLLFTYNFIFGGIFQEICNLLINLINKWIFQWDQGFSGLGWKILLVILITVILSIAIRSIRGSVPLKRTMLSIFQSIIIMFLIGFLSQYIVSITKTIDEYAVELTSNISLSTISEDNDTPNEIRTKALIYELTEVQPFLMRYYGVMSETQIPTKVVDTDHTDKELLSGFDRFWRLWNGYDYGWKQGEESSTLRAARVEACRDTVAGPHVSIGCPNDSDENSQRLNTMVTRNHWADAMFILLFQTLIIIPQTLMLQFFIFIMLLFLGVLRGIVYIRPAFAMFEMCKAFFKQSYHVILEYFNSLFKWEMITLLVSSMFTVMLLLMMKTYIEVARISPMLTFGVSGIWFLLAIAAWALKDRIFTFLQKAMKSLGGLAVAGMSDMHSNPLQELSKFSKQLSNAFDDSFGPASRGGGSMKQDEPVDTNDVTNEKSSDKVYIDEREDVYTENENDKIEKMEKNTKNEESNLSEDDKTNSSEETVSKSDKLESDNGDTRDEELELNNQDSYEDAIDEELELNNQDSYEDAIDEELDLNNEDSYEDAIDEELELNNEDSYEDAHEDSDLNPKDAYQEIAEDENQKPRSQKGELDEEVN